MPGARAPQATRRQQILDAAYEVALDEGIGGVTLRTVAAHAGLSHGLVVFHFREKDQLIAAILDRVLAENELRQREPPAGVDVASDLANHVRAEMRGLTRDPRWLRLFLEYWALGVRDRRLRAKISVALSRYREAFRRHVAESDVRRTRLTPTEADAFAAVAVSLVSGFALQATIGRKHVDPDTYARIVDTAIASVFGHGPDAAASTVELVRSRQPVDDA